MPFNFTQLQRFYRELAISSSHDSLQYVYCYNIPPYYHVLLWNDIFRFVELEFHILRLQYFSRGIIIIS